MPKPLTLMEVFKEYSPQKMSNGQIRMMCPFRDNHTDGSGMYSFFVSPEINAYHCFSCGEHGNLLRLLTRVFKVNYFEAIEMVNLTDYHKEHTEFDMDVMWDYNKPPREFLKRGFSKECLRHFMVGTTSEGSMVIPYYRDFRTLSEIVGYQERWYKGDSRVVKNSKGFDKKGYLYNFDDSKDYVILVEGQSDVWRLYQFGYNACALMGATISDEQVAIISRVFSKVYLALDNDLAGRKGTEVCYEKLRRHVKDILLVPYTSKDPGCCHRREWVNAFKGSTDYLEYTTSMTMLWDDYLRMKTEAIKGIKGDFETS